MTSNPSTQFGTKPGKGQAANETYFPPMASKAPTSFGGTHVANGLSSSSSAGIFSKAPSRVGIDLSKCSEQAATFSAKTILSSNNRSSRSLSQNLSNQPKVCGKPKTKLQSQFVSVINAFSSTLSEVSQMRAEANLDDDEIRQGIEELAIQIEQERTKLLNLDDSLGKNRLGTTFLLSRKTDSSRQINAVNRIIQEINESNIEGIESITGSQALDQESETNRRRFAASSRNLFRKMVLVKERAALLEETNNHPANGQNLLLQRVLDPCCLPS